MLISLARAAGVPHLERAFIAQLQLFIAGSVGFSEAYARAWTLFSSKLVLGFRFSTTFRKHDV